MLKGVKHKIVGGGFDPPNSWLIQPQVRTHYTAPLQPHHKNISI